MAGGFSSNRDIIAASMHKAHSKFEYSNGLIVYSAWHHVHGYGTDHNKWVVRKYTYDANSNLIDMQQLEGAWDNRATLSWI